ncbi:MAG TPA: MFS transporter [Saprospiraceae bacterium]|nr:MFS transporter [Saprospiraceae bacterium]HPI08077.1 MFS transporter [Saprospiraceae bacterium]
MSNINPSRLFTASRMALTVTSMTFAIRAGMLGPLGLEFNLTDSELGWIAGMAFFGFPVATTLGGFFVDSLGMRRLMWVAFGAHLLGLVMTIFAGGFWTLFISTFLVGFANGMVEAVCNPLVASMYPNNKTVMLNKFHVWFPGGIVIGALIAAGMKYLGIGWEVQVAIIIIPTLIYGWLFWGQAFPQTERVDSGVSTAAMFKAVVTPLFLFMIFCMFLTANTELSTTQWIDKLLGNAGANPLLILALVNGLMAVGRYFGEPLIHKLSPKGVLLASSVISVLGLYLLRTTEGDMLYAAAAIFAVGVCYFWPTMLGFVSETIPESGALGLSLMGGAGMLGNWAFQTFFIGPKLDSEKISLAAAGVAPDKIELMAGQSVLSTINILPVILVVAFTALWFYMRGRK